MALTRLAHRLISEHFKNLPKNLAIDATLGNGHDCEFLLRQKFKRVMGFDIQAQAIAASKHRLEIAQLNNVELIHDGHQHLASYINNQKHLTDSAKHQYQTIDCCMFNFGYLPKTDKKITTLATSSVSAIEAALALLSEHGLITLLCYPGHAQGAIETKAVQQTLSQLSGAYSIDEHLDDIPNAHAPILYTVKHRVNV